MENYNHIPSSQPPTNQQVGNEPHTGNTPPQPEPVNPELNQTSRSEIVSPTPEDKPKKSKASFYIGGFLVLALVIGANFALREPAEAPLVDEQQEVEENVEGVVIENGQPVAPILPAYTGRPISEVRAGAGFSAPEEAINKYTADLALLSSALTNNPLLVDDWMAVGTIKKFFNDFEGARDAWEYTVVLFPDYAQAHANLGNVYGFYLGDNARAEVSYKAAIASSLVEPIYYANLAEFYRDVLGDTDKARNIIEEGLANIPNEENLKIFLETL